MKYLITLLIAGLFCIHCNAAQTTATTQVVKAPLQTGFLQQQIQAMEKQSLQTTQSQPVATMAKQPVSLKAAVSTPQAMENMITATQKLGQSSSGYPIHPPLQQNMVYFLIPSGKQCRIMPIYQADGKTPATLDYIMQIFTAGINANPNLGIYIPPCIATP